MSRAAAEAEPQRGFAPPPREPGERGGARHRRALEITEARLRGRWRLYRQRYFDRYRLRKLRWLASRAGFLRRVLNFLLYLAERDRVARVHYAPVVVNLELTNRCNLRCPGCTTGLRSPGARPRGRGTLEELKARMDRVSRHAFQVQLFQLGEPLLHPHFPELCTHATASGLWSVAHTNLSLPLDRLVPRLVDSGPCQLVVSCDAATQETYRLYRVGGDVELVFANLRRIAAEKRRRGSWRPWLTAKFLVFDHNWHEVEAFRDRALEAGADDVLYVPGFSNGIYHTGRVCTEQQFDLRELRWKPRELDPGCRQLWESISFDVDGAVFPCCDAYREEDLFAGSEEAAAPDLMQLWNHPRYRDARAFLAGRGPRRRETLPRPCDECGRTARAAGVGSAAPVRPSAASRAAPG